MKPGWTGWAVLAALPWLLPTHTDPWPTFYPEALAAFVFVLALLALVLHDAGAWAVGSAAATVLLVALIPVAQAMFGLFTYPREALLVAFYLAGLSSSILLGQRAPPALIDALFASLAIAGFLSAGLALYQWLGLDTLGQLVGPAVRGGRPGANLGQPNNLSTLLYMALVGLWWGYSRGRVSGSVAVLGLAFLLLGVVLTQSRTGWLQAALLGTAALLGRRQLLPPRGPAVVLALALGFVGAVLAVVPTSHALLREAPLSLEQQTAVGKRPLIWQLSLAAIAERPWTGWGWNQTARAHSALAPQIDGINGAVGHAHNLALDLLVWNGIPLGAGIALACVWWCWRSVREANSPEQWILLLALAGFCLHAMLELPHVYAFFLLPIGFIVGSIEARSASARSWSVPRPVVLIFGVGFVAILTLIWHEYGLVEDNLLSQRLRDARIGIKPPPPLPDVLLLQPLMQALLDLRTVPRRAMPAAERERLHAASLRYPTVGAQFRDAEAAALNGDPRGAAWSLGRLCLMHSAEECRAAGHDWQRLGAAGKPELDPALLPPAATAPTPP